MSASVGSTAFFAASLLLISVLVLLLLRYYLPLRSTPAYLLVPVFLALVLPASIVILVPIDLASSAVQEDGQPRGVWMPEEVMLASWRIAYWLIFVLTWVILPLLGEYADSGHREPKDRLAYSVKVNIKFQLIVLACSIAGLVYFFISAGFRVANVKATVISLAYAWGLVIAIYLMGHGLVAVPRRVYRSASISGSLKRLQTQAVSLYERMEEAITELEGFEMQVLQLCTRKTGSARDFREWIEELAETSDLTESQIRGSSSARLAAANVPAVITSGYLADLGRKLKRARHKRIRFIEEWTYLVRSADHHQKILDSVGSKSLVFKTVSTGKSTRGFTILTPYTRFLYHYHLLPAMRIASSALLGIGSVALIWSEVTHSLFAPLSVVGYSLIHHPRAEEDGKIGIGGQILAAGWLMYMFVTTLASVSEVKVWGNRALVRRHTYAESATWYATYVARLTVPLSYNFITLLPPDIFKESAFYTFLGRPIDITSLGEAFSKYFPILILVPVLATTFGLYGRIKRTVGFGVIVPEDEEQQAPGSATFREGKRLIDRELNRGRTGGAGGGESDGQLGLTTRDASPALYNDQSYRDVITDDAENTTMQWAEEPSQDTSGPVSQSSRTLGPSFAPYSDRDASSQSRAPPSTRPTEPYSDDYDEDTNMFQDFAHRVKNTIDTIDKPNFNFNFSKPKWLQQNNHEAGDSASSSNSGNGGRNFGSIGRLINKGRQSSLGNIRI